MKNLIIWGNARDIVAGDLPGGSPEEVSTLAGLEASLDGRGVALVLADPARLEAEREKTEAWRQNGGSSQAVLVVVADAASGDEVLRRFPFVDDLLVRPVTAVRLRHRLERAFEAIHSRRVIQQLEKQVSRKGDELSELNKIGVALSAERDIDQLLALILYKSREITWADAGSLYLVERGSEDEQPSCLRFKLAQNDSVIVPFEEFTMPLDESSIAGYVATFGEPLSVQDAYQLPEDAPYHISQEWDEKSGYRTKSMLVVPMRDHKDEVIGIVQLINKKRNRDTVLQPVIVAEEEVIPFTSVDQELVKSLASQAAVAFENADLIRRIRRLFDEFVHAAVAAVEQRDPTTSGHSERVAILTVGLAERVDAIATGTLADEHFSRDQVEEIRYAALLHDFGKVAVQEKYLRKGKKFYASQLIAIRQRFAYILKAREAEYLKGQLEALDSGRATAAYMKQLEDEYRRDRAEIERQRDAVLRANEPTVVEDESFRAIMDLKGRPFASWKEEEDFPVEDWAEPPYLSSEEWAALQIRKGSLTGDERERIQQHVTHTYEFLQKIPWTGEFRNIPEIAWKHHEKLDGSGYPRQLTAAEIPAQSRMMTISDIYDALVAWDRPYKRAVPEERAREILHEEAREGKIDKDLLQVFLEAKVFELPAFRERLQRRPASTGPAAEAPGEPAPSPLGEPSPPLEGSAKRDRAAGVPASPRGGGSTARPVEPRALQAKSTRT
jgi:HD-GYP domain-containing protein (c-di-GMP phosphodiesterase class II)